MMLEYQKTPSLNFTDMQSYLQILSHNITEMLEYVHTLSNHVTDSYSKLSQTLSHRYTWVSADSLIQAHSYARVAVYFFTRSHIYPRVFIYSLTNKHSQYKGVWDLRFFSSISVKFNFFHIKKHVETFIAESMVALYTCSMNLIKQVISYSFINNFLHVIGCYFNNGPDCSLIS